MQIKKWEANETRYAQTTFTSLSIFCFAQTAASQRIQFTSKFQKQFKSSSISRGVGIAICVLLILIASDVAKVSGRQSDKERKPV
ncbi:hypothetical protein [Herminiimonas fonticola]|uniref:hypothetical protein n=1 Tax=Herminiimonas fonticola TaxID=303380 RepID=UPI000DD9DBD7|nr:hypothetical protein [Herminiimonas fonticola]